MDCRRRNYSPSNPFVGIVIWDRTSVDLVLPTWYKGNVGKTVHAVNAMLCSVIEIQNIGNSPLGIRHSSDGHFWVDLAFHVLFLLTAVIVLIRDACNERQSETFYHTSLKIMQVAHAITSILT